MLGFNSLSFGALGDVSSASLIVRPLSDISKGNWVPSSGSTLSDMINESTPNDSTYIATSTATSTEMLLPAFVFPIVGIPVLSVRASSQSNSTLGVKLKQNDIFLSGCVWSQILDGLNTTYQFVLNESQISTIQNPTTYPLSMVISIV